MSQALILRQGTTLTPKMIRDTIRFENTLLECEEAPLKFQEQGKYTYVWYGSSGRFELL